MAKVKRVKLTAIPIIQKRLYRFASISCRDRAKNRCEVCGIEAKAINPKTNNRIKLEAHHVLSRSNADSPLKWDVRNLCCLCSTCHKFGNKSAHKHALWFAKWFYVNRKEDYLFILEHDEFKCNVKDRQLLDYMQDCVCKNIYFDYQRLKDCGKKDELT